MYKIAIPHIVIICLLLTQLIGCQEDKHTHPVDSARIMTVSGPISMDSLGFSLIHEHVFLDWTGADSINSELWSEDDAYQIIIPYLEEMKARGVKTFLECTPNYLGRNPQFLQKLSTATGLQILTNTGFYAARQNKYIPAFAFEASADSLAKIWITEFEQGIDDTGIRPGFIKIGMDSKDQLTEMDEKLVRAAARTHLKTGLTIVAHTGDDTTAAQEIEILQEEGVSPAAFVWTHAQNGTQAGHVRHAKKGAWISLDGMGWIRPTIEGDSSALLKYIAFLENLKANGLLDKTLISHDAGWYTHGQDAQHGYKPYTDIFDLVIPLLKEEGFSEADIEQLMVKNPQKAYAMYVREAAQPSSK